MTGAPAAAEDDVDEPARVGTLLLIARETERVRLGLAASNPWTLHPEEIGG